jgi:hypothetical protein
MGPQLPPLPSSSPTAAEAMARHWKQASVLSALVAEHGVAGGEAGGRQGAGGSLEGQVASGAPPLPPCSSSSVAAVTLASVAAGGSFVSDGSAGGSGSAHGQRKHGGPWNTAAAVVHVFGGGGAAHGRCWLVERFVEAVACGRVRVAAWEALVPQQPPTPPSFLASPW